MLDNRRLLITVVSLAIIGVLALFAYSTTIKPVEVGLQDITKDHVGKIITTNGTISSARILSDGSVSMKLCDICTEDELTVYFPSSAYEEWDGNLTPGSIIEVTGEVSLYQEELEISIASVRDVTVIKEAGSISYDLRTIMNSMEMFDGMVVSTNGSMLDISVIESDGELIGTGFTLYQRYDNSSYSLQCMAFDADLTGSHADWDSVNVTGQISYYANAGTWQLIILSID